MTLSLLPIAPLESLNIKYFTRLPIFYKNHVKRDETKKINSMTFSPRPYAHEISTYFHTSGGVSHCAFGVYVDIGETRRSIKKRLIRLIKKVLSEPIGSSYITMHVRNIERLEKYGLRNYKETKND